MRTLININRPFWFGGSYCADPEPNASLDIDHGLPNRFSRPSMPNIIVCDRARPFDECAWPLIIAII